MKLTWNAALEETEMVLFETVHKLLKTTGIDAQDVRIPSNSEISAFLVLLQGACGTTMSWHLNVYLGVGMTRPCGD